MKCPVCGINETVKHPDLGVLPCESCRLRRSKFSTPDPIEFTSDEIKDARVKFKDDLIQPYRDGVLSKEYVDKYGSKGIKATKEEIKGAKNVWKDI